MYWIVALFDEETEKKIKQIWKELSEESLSFYGEEIKNGRPHVTLASYEDIDKKKFIRKMNDLYSNKKEIEICFNTLGSFLNYGTLFFSPTVTKELMDLHASHYEFFKANNDKANSLYMPDKWIPHCTLANKLPEEELAAAFQYCLKRNESLTGKITAIGLIELAEKQGEQMEAPIIHKVSLKERPSLV
ncbi:2'-5' RNA ligase family protein [Rossellomorea vietnamensis]|uniref:2'-5' RNA ligase family protein n=1 Tax=Rossellomorea vietnamensis TaxID=218284 RepID=A0A5D4MKB9_9BACI|nr:2'-5' RNA ligase family protein [Rossellomorea vietnamensis]TYS01436.1 2'-5' RNA ligase family protein [Rossellomorea vietnamensis]